MLVYNTHVMRHKSTGFTPYETLFGNKAHLPSNITQEPILSYFYDVYMVNLKQKLNYTWKIARDNLTQIKSKSKVYYDNIIVSHSYKIGDLMYVLNKQTNYYGIR